MELPTSGCGMRTSGPLEGGGRHFSTCSKGTGFIAGGMGSGRVGITLKDYNLVEKSSWKLDQGKHVIRCASDGTFAQDAREADPKGRSRDVIVARENRRVRKACWHGVAAVRVAGTEKMRPSSTAFAHHWISFGTCHWWLHLVESWWRRSVSK